MLSATWNVAKLTEIQRNAEHLLSFKFHSHAQKLRKLTDLGRSYRMFSQP